MRQIIREMLRSILDTYRDPTPDEVAAIRAELDERWPIIPRLSNDVPTLPLNPSTEPFPLNKGSA